MPELNFSNLNNELEVIMNDLQNNTLDIDQVVKKYERGIEIVDQLEDYLHNAENKIKKLKTNKLKTKKKQ